MERRSFTNAQRIRIVNKVNRLMKQGKSNGEACEQVGVAASQFYRWQRNLNSVRTTKKAKRVRAKVNIHKSQAPAILPIFLRLGDGVTVEGRLRIDRE